MSKISNPLSEFFIFKKFQNSSNFQLLHRVVKLFHYESMFQKEPLSSGASWISPPKQAD